MIFNSPIFDQSGRLKENCTNINFFDIYGFHNHPLAINESEISDRYLDLSRRIHPDLFQTATNSEKELSIFYSELVNNGYKTLKHPFKRARYYLEVNSALNESKEIPAEVVSEVFEIQDLLATSELSDNDRTELNNYLNQFQSVRNDYKNRLNQLFHESEQMDKRDLYKQLNDLISANAYVERIFINIEAKLEMTEDE